MKILSSYKTTIILLAIYALVMAVATFVERSQGTAFVKQTIYYSPLFFLIQLLIVVNFFMALVRYRLFQQKRWGLLLLHFSFIVILAGALTTHVFGKEGILHLRESEISNRIMIQTHKGIDDHQLPFQVELVKFTLTRYPGSMSPSSYESELLIHVDGMMRRERVYMNHVVDIKGYRFFQASFDEDEMGTVLSVNQDVAGRSITYMGYFLLLIASIMCVSAKNGRVRVLFRQLNQIH